MFGENEMTVSSERLLGAELVRAAEGILAGMRPEVLDSVAAMQLAAVQVLLRLYWQLRHRPLRSPMMDRIAGPSRSGVDASVEWLSALVCSVPADGTGPAPAPVRWASPHRQT